MALYRTFALLSPAGFLDVEGASARSGRIAGAVPYAATGEAIPGANVLVRESRRARRGQVIGRIEDTGNSTCPTFTSV